MKKNYFRAEIKGIKLEELYEKRKKTGENLRWEAKGNLLNIKKDYPVTFAKVVVDFLEDGTISILRNYKRLSGSSVTHREGSFSLEDAKIKYPDIFEAKGKAIWIIF